MEHAQQCYRPGALAITGPGPGVPEAGPMGARTRAPGPGPRTDPGPGPSQIAQSQVGWGGSEEGVMRRMEADLRAAAQILFDAQQAPWWAAPPKKVQVRKKGSVALLRRRTRRVLRRMRKRKRRAQVVASASASQ